MKILIVSTSFSIFPGDNISPFIWKHGKSLKDLGWEVSILAPHYKGLPENENWEGVEIYRFRYFIERFENFGYDAGGIVPNIMSKPWRLLKLPFYIFGMYRESMKLIKEKEFDLVNFHWLFPCSFWLPWLVKITGIHAVVTGHGTDIHLALKWPFSFFFKRAMKVVSAITLNSEYMSKIAAQSSKLPRTEIIPMAVDTGLFKTDASQPSDSQVILYVGRLMKQKGIYLLLDSFKKVLQKYPQAILEFVGPGPEFNNLKNAANESNLGKNVRLTGVVEHRRLPEIYSKARMVVLPSLIGEGMGLTPVEAGACGVPTVTFGFGGTAELIENNSTGIITAPSVDELSAVLIKLMGDNENVDKLGLAAYDSVKANYSWNAISNRFNILFKEICEKSSQVESTLSRKIGNLSAIFIILIGIIYIAKMIFDRLAKISDFIK